jgi:hypothetical protein
MRTEVPNDRKWLLNIALDVMLLGSIFNSSKQDRDIMFAESNRQSIYAHVMFII